MEVLTDLKDTICDKVREMVAEATTLRELKDAVAVLDALHGSDPETGDAVRTGVVELGTVRETEE